MTADHSPAPGKMVDLDALERLAKAATPGPWAWNPSYAVVQNCPKKGLCDLFAVAGMGNASQIEDDVANMKHIAATNPATILAMIRELRAAREVIRTCTANNQRWELMHRALKAYDAAIGGEGKK